MKWTKDKPKEAGWYWFSGLIKLNNKWRKAKLLAVELREVKGYDLRYYLPTRVSVFENVTYTKRSFDGFWYGPIETPKPPIEVELMKSEKLR